MKKTILAATAVILATTFCAAKDGSITQFPSAASASIAETGIPEAGMLNDSAVKAGQQGIPVQPVFQLADNRATYTYENMARTIKAIPEMFQGKVVAYKGVATCVIPGIIKESDKFIAKKTAYGYSVVSASGLNGEIKTVLYVKRSVLNSVDWQILEKGTINRPGVDDTTYSVCDATVEKNTVKFICTGGVISQGQPRVFVGYAIMDVKTGIFSDNDPSMLGYADKAHLAFLAKLINQ